MLPRLLLLLSLLQVSFAQQPPSPPSTQILIPVVVTDSSGFQVSGLQPNDFLLKVGHKEVLPETAEEVLPFLLPPDKNGQQRRPVFLVLDKLTVVPPELGSVAPAILKFLAQSVESGDGVTLLTFDGDGLKLVHSFTTPASVLAAALQLLDKKTHMLGGHYESAAASNVPDELKPKVQDELASLEELLAVRKRVNAPPRQMEDLYKVGNLCRRIPGRKAAFWITHWSYVRPESGTTLRGLEQTYATQFEDAVEALNEGRTSIYPLALPPQQPMNSTLDQAEALVLAVENGNAETALTQIARATGGELLHFGPDLAKAIQPGLSHFSSYYLLTHKLGPPPAHVEWNKLETKTKREGARVHSPEGFFALP
jgi:VWFA-related protein